MIDPLLVLYLVVALALVMWALGWMRRDSPLAPSYLWLTSAFLVWTLAYVWELEASTLEGMVLAAKVQYLAVPLVPPAILAFCIRYTGHERRPSPWALGAFLLIPVATTVLAWTNELHGLIWDRIEVTPVGARSLLSLGYGRFFPVYVAVSYAYLLAALVLSVRTWLQSTELARRQSRLIVAGLVFPWIANVLQISGLNPLHPLDLTPMALAFSCGFAAVGALNLRMLTLAPVARDQILAATTDGIVVLDETGRVVDVNEAAAILLGRRAADAVGQAGATVLGPFAAAVNANPDGGTLVNTEHAGEERSFHCTWFDVTSRGGRHLGGALAIRDVTKLTGIHRALARTRDDLESEIVARARELTLTYDRLAHEAGIRGSRGDMDRTLSERERHTQNLESVGTLAGGIAHDFNNILTSIMGYTDLAERRVTADGPVRSYLSQVSAASLRAKGLVEQILTFSRRVETERRPMEVEPVLREVVALIRPTLPVTVAVSVDVEETCGPIRGDPTRIHQLLMNLATNARQALGDRGGRLGFSLSTGTPKGPLDVAHPTIRGRPCVRIEVSDTGPGIEPSARGRLFEPFFTTRPKGQGTGLGLSVVHGTVLAHEGGVRVESEPGEGSTFVVYLPLAADAEPVPVADHPPPRPGSERLLVVDDEAPIAELLRTSLGAFGYRVSSFTDPLEALTAFEEAPEAWDVVITDEAMPGMTGLELAARMAALRRDVPIIVQTGLRVGGLSASLSPAVVAVLQKPVTATELSRTIRRALEGGDSVAS